MRNMELQEGKMTHMENYFFLKRASAADFMLSALLAPAPGPRVEGLKKSQKLDDSFSTTRSALDSRQRLLKEVS